jgi:hypothetical protein
MAEVASVNTRADTRVAACYVFNPPVCPPGTSVKELPRLIASNNPRGVVDPHALLGPEQLAESNAQQVRHVCTINKGLGPEVATQDEAREMLQLKGRDRVAYRRHRRSWQLG